MKKVFINVSECEPGMHMAETIFNEYGGIIVAEGTILDAHLINKLRNLDVSKIKIYISTNDVIISNDSEVFRAQYNENIEVVKDVLHDISTGRNLDVNKVNNVSDSIFVRINENRDIVGCINQIRDVDEYTYKHSVNVSLVSMLIGKWMRLSPEKIKLIVQCGLLHDIGKGKIPSEILNKPGALTFEEFEEMKKHPIYGYRALEAVEDISKDITMAVLMHHEREDGSGYPMGAKSPQIHEFAKILAVADIYDAMTSNRSYKEKGSPFDVFELMENDTFGILDHRVVTTFLNNIAAYYIGDLVRLSNNEVGEIIYINPRHISKPVLKVGNHFYDLTQEKGLKIMELF